MSESNGVAGTIGRIMRLWICTIISENKPVQVAVAANDFADALVVVQGAFPDQEITGVAQAVPSMPVFVANRKE